MSDAVRTEIAAFTRQLLGERLKQLTDKQRTFFKERVFPKGVKREDLVGAIDLCDRTIKKNKAGR